MDIIEEYLSQFEDFELAFFWKYKLDTYMEETQNEIQAYLKKRNLNETKMNALIEDYSHKSFPDNELRCPRCKSEKIITQKEKAFDSMNGYKLAEELLDYKDIGSGDIDCTCAVCGLDFSPPKHYSFMRKVLNVALGTILDLWRVGR